MNIKILKVIFCFIITTLFWSAGIAGERMVCRGGVDGDAVHISCRLGVGDDLSHPFPALVVYDLQEVLFSTCIEIQALVEADTVIAVEHRVQVVSLEAVLVGDADPCYGTLQIYRRSYSIDAIDRSIS